MRRPFKKRKNAEKNVASMKFAGDLDINKFIKMLMVSGKLQLAHDIFLKAIMKVVDQNNPKTEDKNSEAVAIFKEIIEKGSPALEVKTKRVGGANYQVPVEISFERKKAILFRWILAAARKMVGKMSDNLAKVMLEILDSRGEVMRKKDELHKMAAANRVFQNLGTRK
jgi:small subunit ribosomal protein S7